LAQTRSNNVISTDIDNFCNAYDQITSIKDSSRKYEILDRVFISKGTTGLEAMMASKAYTDKQLGFFYLRDLILITAKNPAIASAP